MRYLAPADLLADSRSGYASSVGVVETRSVSVCEGALDWTDCRRIIDAVDGAPAVTGGVLRRGGDEVDLRLRSCTEHVIDPDAMRPVITALAEIARRLHDIDGMRLDGPRFCRYNPGEYFRAHRDRSDDPADPAAVRRRELSFICFLNGVDHAADLPAFDGGLLVMYLPQADGSVAPLNIRPTAGTIVAFPSDVLHEVRPVREGVRYTAIAWLYSEGEGKL